MARDKGSCVAREFEGPCHAETLCERETGILLPNNLRQHRTSHALNDVLPLRICADHCSPCQPRV